MSKPSKEPPRQGLNEFTFGGFVSRPGGDLLDLNVASSNISLHVFGIRDTILSLIERHEIRIGCSPWFNRKSQIGTALERKGQFSIVTSDELHRPEPAGPSKLGVRATFPAGLLGKVAELEWPFRPRDVKSALTVESIKMRKGAGACPIYARLHSKFLLFIDYDGQRFVPKEAIVGSYNLNDNSEHSFECVVSIREPKIMWALLSQWYQMLGVAMYQRGSDLIDLVFDREFEEDWEILVEREKRAGYDAYARPWQWDEIQRERQLEGPRRSPPDWWRW